MPGATAEPAPVHVDGAGAPDARTPDGAWTLALAAPRAEAAATTASVAPATPPPAAAQLVAQLAPLRTGPDGVHRMTMLLNPEELGPITVVAEVRGDQLSVHLAGTTEAGREALRTALPQLERELRDSGFTACALDVARDAPQHDRPHRPMWMDGGPGGGSTGGRPDGADDQPGRDGSRRDDRQPDGSPGQPHHPAGPTGTARTVDLTV